MNNSMKYEPQKKKKKEKRKQHNGKKSSVICELLRLGVENRYKFQ